MAFSWKENFSVGFSAGKTFINCSPDEKVYGVYAPQLWKGDGDSGSATVRVEQAAVFEGLCTPRQSINEVSGVSYEMTFRSTGDDLFLSTANGEEKYIEDIDIIPTWLTGAWKGSATVESKNVDYYLCFTPERGSVYVWFVSTDGHLYKGEFLYTLEDGVSVDLDTYRCSSGIINSLYMVDEESYIETDCSEDVEKLLTYLTLFGNLGLANFDISLIKDELFVVNIRRENKSGWEDLVFVGVEEG